MDHLLPSRSKEYFLSFENEVVKCSAVLLKLMLQLNISTHHSQNLGKTLFYGLCAVWSIWSRNTVC